MKKAWSLKDHPKMPKPKNEDEYLEKMSMIIFSAGLNWNVVKNKWPGIKKLFKDFSLKKVAQMDMKDKDRLVTDPAMIRSLPKINAVINNANALLAVEGEFGSIGNYIKDIKKLGEAVLIKDIKKRFSFLGDSTSLMFLYAVGEKI